MMNFIAVLFVNYLVSGPWKSEIKQSINPLTDTITVSLQLPKILSGTRLHLGLLIGIIIAVLCYVLLFKSTFGYNIKAAGLNPKAARFGGINVGNTLIFSMILSGGIAGIGGMSEIAGLHHYLMDGISPGYGYTAIVVALLGRLNPIGIIFSSILFASLIVGADTMQQLAGVPISIIRIIQALVIIFVLVSEVFIRKRRKKYDLERNY
jgi:simple sugar transport system permease protein